MSKKTTLEFSLGEIIGSTLADLRKNNGMTQKEFAKILGVSESSIAHYEQGITMPGADIILKCAEYFNVNIGSSSHIAFIVSEDLITPIG